MSRPGHRRSAPGPAAARPPARGMALMEALIAVLLLSFAALGYAAVQLRGITANHGAMLRSQAGLLAYEMSDRLRANRAGVAAGAYDNLVADSAPPGCGGATACSPASMAVLDHAQWLAALAAALPAGRGVVCLDSTPDDGSAAAPACDGAGAVLAVKVFWQEKGVAARWALGVRP